MPTGQVLQLSCGVTPNVALQGRPLAGVPCERLLERDFDWKPYRDYQETNAHKGDNEI